MSQYDCAVCGEKRCEHVIEDMTNLNFMIAMMQKEIGDLREIIDVTIDNISKFKANVTVDSIQKGLIDKIKELDKN